MTNIEKITEILNKYTEPQDGDYYLHGCIMNDQLEDLAEEIVKKFDLCAVVKSYYCREEEYNGIRCEKQCFGCTGVD